jgi:hypothetical protein
MPAGGLSIGVTAAKTLVVQGATDDAAACQIARAAGANHLAVSFEDPELKKKRGRPVG